MESLIIGIAGGSGSGKSTFTNRIKKRFGDDVVVFITTIITADRMESTGTASDGKSKGKDSWKSLLHQNGSFPRFYG